MNFLEFISFSDPTLQKALLGSLFISICAALVGVFTYYQKKSLVGDAVSHSVFPGICMAFIISGTKNPIFLLLGAFLAGWLSIVSFDFLLRDKRIKSDAALASVLSVFFGLGILLLNHIQNGGNANQIGLQHFLMGNVAAMSSQDVLTYGLISSFVSLMIILFFPVFKLISFNKDFAQSKGYKVKSIQFLFSSLIVICIAIGINAVGVILMAALLITPASSARWWSNKLERIAVLAAFFSVVSATIGAYISFSFDRMPAGPWMVIVLSIIAIISILFAYPKGVIYGAFKRRKAQEKMLVENVLKSFYHIEEREGQANISAVQLANTRSYDGAKLSSALRILKKRSLVLTTGQNYQLSQSGREEARRIIRLHRLWELYLGSRLNFKKDHVHNDAEAIEHIITPEIERQLLDELGDPEIGLHNDKIPLR